MPEARMLHPELKALSTLDLQIRMDKLVEEDNALRAKGESLSDEKLIEIVAILGILRGKSAGPPKAAKEPKGLKNAAPSLDAL